MQVLFRRLAATFFVIFWVLSNRPGDVTGVCLWSKKHKIIIIIIIIRCPTQTIVYILPHKYYLPFSVEKFRHKKSARALRCRPGAALGSTAVEQNIHVAA